MNLFDIPKLEQDLKTLESKTLEDGFWNDSKKSGKVLQEIKVIKNKKDKYLKLESELSNLEEMNELLQLEDDEALVNELLKNTSNIQKEIENLNYEDICTLLNKKWIDPIINGLDKMINNIVIEFAKSIEKLSTKYEQTLKDIDNEISKTEKELAGMIDELIGSEYDMKGLEDFKSLICGD